MEYWWALLLCWISWVNESDVSLFQTITLTHDLFTFLGLLWIYIQCGMFEVKRKLMICNLAWPNFGTTQGIVKLKQFKAEYFGRTFQLQLFVLETEVSAQWRPPSARRSSVTHPQNVATVLLSCLYLRHSLWKSHSPEDKPHR